MLTPLFIAAAVGYLLGSLPFGYLVARAKGVNIFEVGSKNPGATNVRRTLGSGPGNLVFILDVVKGAVAAGWPLLLALGNETDTGPGSHTVSFVSVIQMGDVALYNFEYATEMAIAGLVGALLGHSFSCFTKFRGGKGVATATGGLLVTIPYSAVISAVVWAVAFYASRYVSLASILAAIALPISVFVLGGRSALLFMSLAVALFVILRHRSNIQRLLAGTEAKFARKQPTPTP